MRFYGNYRHLIKPEWVTALLTTKGIPISPWKDHTNEIKEDEVVVEQTTAQTPEEAALFAKDGPYGNTLIMAEMFTADNLPFELDLGELNHLLTGDWWFVKQLPGQFMPLHRDTKNTYDDNIRIWMPWLDYQEGHVFIHEGKFVKDYKAGDMWQYDKDNDLHGSVNIGLTPRITFQISQKVIP